MTRSPEQALHYEHEQGRPQSWENVDQDIASLVTATVDSVSALLDPAVMVGAYVHGSLSTGSFYRPKSDIDLLFVVEERLTGERRRAVAESLCDLSDGLAIVGDIEVSVVRRRDTLDFHHPLPYEVHYGENWKGRIRQGHVDWTKERTDPDLAVHCKAVRERGLRLKGLPIVEVFGVVPVEDYRESIHGDLDWILSDGHLAESPYYGILNCCRVLEMESEGWDQVLSKDEGGTWGLSHLPEQFRALIAQAIACYRSSERVTPADRSTDGHPWDPGELAAFRNYVTLRVS